MYQTNQQIHQTDSGISCACIGITSSRVTPYWEYNIGYDAKWTKYSHGFHQNKPSNGRSNNPSNCHEASGWSILRVAVER